MHASSSSSTLSTLSFDKSSGNLGDRTNNDGNNDTNPPHHMMTINHHNHDANKYDDDIIIVALKDSEAVFEEDVESLLDGTGATATEEEFDQHTEAVAKYKEIEARFKSTLDELLMVRSFNNVRMFKAVHSGLQKALESQIDDHTAQVEAAMVHRNLIITSCAVATTEDDVKEMIDAGIRVNSEQTALRATIVKFNRATFDANRLYATDMDALCKLKRVVDIMLKNYDEKDTVHSEHFGAASAKRRCWPLLKKKKIYFCIINFAVYNNVLLVYYYCLFNQRQTFLQANHDGQP